MDGKSAKKGTKTGKNRAKNAKKPLKKSKFALAHLTKGTPSAEKSPPGTGTARAVAGRALAPRPMGSKKPPQNIPQNSRQKVIHNRRLM